jgi:hypothetical protein
MEPQEVQPAVISETRPIVTWSEHPDPSLEAQPSVEW